MTLGLWVLAGVFLLAAGMGAPLSLRSAPGRGSTFAITMPRADRAANPPPYGSEATSDGRRSDDAPRSSSVGAVIEFQ